MRRDRMSKIGVLIIVVGVGFFFLWWYSIRYFLNDWYSSGQISALAFAALNAVPPAALALIGFTLYIIGRRNFWAADRLKGPLAVIGLALLALGGFLATWFWAFSTYAANNPGSPYDRPLSYYLTTSSPYFILFALWILPGLLIFADAVEAMSSTKKAGDSA